MTATPPRGELDGIDTLRLTLRRPRLDDFDDSAALWSDPQVTRHIGGKPFGREEAWLRFLRTIGHWTVMGFGFWIVRERTTGRFVGEIGLAEFRRDLAPPLPAAPEAGWVIAPWAHGQGFATEAVPAAIDAYAGRFGPGPTVCIIDPENSPSIRVAHKCGFRECGRAKLRDFEVLVFERPPGVP